METTQTQNLIKPEIKSIAISCNTFLRPKILEKTLESIAQLNIPAGIKITVLVVDNDANASARTVIDKFQVDFPFDITYKVEEKRGLANARNRLLKEALELGVSHIAILDDDDIANIQVGDVIKFQSDNYYVIHRVYAIEETDDGLLFTTKGDNNNAPDEQIIWYSFGRQIGGSEIFRNKDEMACNPEYKNSNYSDPYKALEEYAKYGQLKMLNITTFN